MIETPSGASGISAVELLKPLGAEYALFGIVDRSETIGPGMLLVLADHRPARLTRVRQALAHLPEADQRRLGVLTDWKTGPHLLTYRQTERTFGLAARALEKDNPDGTPSQILARICDDLLEASIPGPFKHASTALAVSSMALDLPLAGRPCRIRVAGPMVTTLPVSNVRGSVMS